MMVVFAFLFRFLCGFLLFTALFFVFLALNGSRALRPLVIENRSLETVWVTPVGKSIQKSFLPQKAPDFSLETYPETALAPVIQVHFDCLPLSYFGWMALPRLTRGGFELAAGQNRKFFYDSADLDVSGIVIRNSKNDFYFLESMQTHSSSLSGLQISLSTLGDLPAATPIEREIFEAGLSPKRNTLIIYSVLFLGFLGGLVEWARRRSR